LEQIFKSRFVIQREKYGINQSNKHNITPVTTGLVWIGIGKAPGGNLFGTISTYAAHKIFSSNFIADTLVAPKRETLITVFVPLCVHFYFSAMRFDNIITQTQSQSYYLACWFCVKQWLKDFIHYVLRNAAAVVSYTYFYFITNLICSFRY
jgi:hypothetical protein